MRLVIAAAFSAALAVAMPAAAGAPISVPLAPNEVLLEVSGTGIVRTPADRIMVTAAGRSTAPTLAAARQANEAQMARLVAAARSFGIPAENIRPAEGQLGFVGNEAQAWTVYAPKEPGPQAVVDIIEIRLSDAARFPDLRRALEAAGAVQVTGPAYSLSDDHGARAEAKVRALAEARAQAQIYAKAANMRLGRLLRISDRAATSIEDAASVQEMMRAMAGLTSAPGNQVETRVRVAVDFALLPD